MKSFKNHKTKKTQKKKKWILPLAVVIVVACFATIMTYPMIKMSPKNIPIGVISLDKGTDIDQGHVNLGEVMLDKITENSSDADEEESPVVWKTYYNDLDDLNKGIEEGEIYGALIIPENFSETNVSSLEGFNKLSEGLSKISTGMGTLSEGTEKFSEGLSELPEGMSRLAAGTSALDQGLGKLENAMGDKNSEKTLLFASNAIANGAKAIETSVNQNLKPVSTTLSKNVTSAQSNASKVDEYINEANEALSQNPPDTDAAQKALTKAQSASTSTNVNLNAVSGSSVILTAGVEGLALQMKTFSTGASGINAGLETLKVGISGMKGGTEKLNAGLSAFSENAPVLSTGADNLSMATSGLNEGMSKLSDSVTEMVDTMANTVIDPDSTEDESEDEEAASSITFLLNQSKNQTISSSLEAAITAMSAETGMSIETEYINPIPDEITTSNLTTVFMLFTYILSLLSSVILTRLFPINAISRSFRIKQAVIQLVYAILIAGTVGFLGPLIITYIGGIDIMSVNLVLFMMISSFAFICLVIGCIDLMGLAGMSVPILMLILGNTTANFPYEFLPSFWQNWIYPWMPLRFLTDGAREIVFMNGEFWNDMSMNFVWVIVIGLTLLILSIIKPIKKNNVLPDKQLQAIA